MREIKFRQPIWVKGEFGGWHYWGFLTSGNFSGPNTGSSSISKAKEESQQYTGLKDKNGVEYADNDIMQWIQKDYTSLILEKVVWHEAGWWIADLSSGDLLMPLTEQQARLRTIIGNIYENPELLK